MEEEAVGRCEGSLNPCQRLREPSLNTLHVVFLHSCSEPQLTKPTICITFYTKSCSTRFSLFILLHLLLRLLLFYIILYHLCSCWQRCLAFFPCPLTLDAAQEEKFILEPRRGDFLSVCSGASKWQGLLWRFTASSLVNNAAACIHVTAEEVEEWDITLFWQLGNTLLTLV